MLILWDQIKNLWRANFMGTNYIFKLFEES